jgi:hypothetical protein
VNKAGEQVFARPTFTLNEQSRRGIFDFIRCSENLREAGSRYPMVSGDGQKQTRLSR